MKSDLRHPWHRLDKPYMPSFFLYGLIAYGVVQLAKLASRVMTTPTFLILLVLILATQIVNHQLERFWHFEPQATVKAYVINGLNPILDMDHVNRLSLTVESTYERPFRPTYAACFIHGPVYYDPRQSEGDDGGFISRLEASQTPTAQHIGERQLVVKLIPVSTVTFAYDDANGRKVVVPLPKALRIMPWKAPEPVGAKYD